MKKYTRKLKQRHEKKKRGGGIKTKCVDFCKNDFVPNKELIWRKIARDENEVYLERTPKQKKFSLKVCKKVFCNKGCKKKNQGTRSYKDISGFYKDIVNDFDINYTNKQINKLQEKGALSGCLKDDRYVDNYIDRKT